MLMHQDATAAITTSATITDEDRVHAAVAALSWLDREALVLRFRDRLALSAIAERTGTTAAMVRVRLHRAAVRVEAEVGHRPLGTSPVAACGRDPEVMVEDAELGITPMLADRLDAALRGQRDATMLSPLQRAVRELVEAVTSHAPQLATLGSIGGLAIATIVTMAAAT